MALWAIFFFFFFFAIQNIYVNSNPELANLGEPHLNITNRVLANLTPFPQCIKGKYIMYYEQLQK